MTVSMSNRLRGAVSPAYVRRPFMPALYAETSDRRGILSRSLWETRRNVCRTSTDDPETSVSQGEA